MFKISAIFLMTLLMICGCTTPSTPGPENVIRKDGRVWIVDRTGKRWEVTHAEQAYGMKAEEFQFGLGPNAIEPILTPQYLDPGESGFPQPAGTFLVIGVDMNGGQRAYPISVLTRHEVAIEVFGSAHVAVAY